MPETPNPNPNPTSKLRLFRLKTPWADQLWNYLKSEEDILYAIPNEEGRKFSVWQGEHVIIDPAWQMLKSLGIGLNVYRNFKLDARSRHATMLHRDHPSNPCFAVNICVRGSMKVHFYDDIEPMFNQRSAVGTNPVYFTAGTPRETYVVGERELFIMDTSAIHQADTTDCQTSVLLASFVPKPQYRFEDALATLDKAGFLLS